MLRAADALGEIEREPILPEDEAPALGIESRIVSSPWLALGSGPVRAVVVTLGLSLFVEQVPALERVRTLSASETLSLFVVDRRDVELGVGEAELKTETSADAQHSQEDAAESQKAGKGPIAEAPVAEAPVVATASLQNTKKPPRPLELPAESALDTFFGSLKRTQTKTADAITRVLHFGDSLIVSDYVSSTLRRNLQREFGDAGHGFVLMASAWPAYSHQDVVRFASSGFTVSRIVGPYAEDGLYGLGGVSFRAPPGVRSRVGTSQTGDFGRTVSRFTLAYLEEPGGGTLKMTLDGGTPQEITTDAPQKRSAFHSVQTTDGPHELEVVTTSGNPRTFGIILERDEPGVVLDALGVQGARIRFLDKQDDAHWAEQLRARNPNLIIYQFGANESSDGFVFPMEEYASTMRAVLRQSRAAVPTASCLVIGAMDRAAKRGEELVSLRVLPHLVREQREAALDVGCAFFDTYQAMGGYGSMPIWVRRGLGQADFTHPTGAGAEVLGNWIYRGLMDLYQSYLGRNL